MNIQEVIKSGKFYTYAHIRNDTNKVFYIGKGKGKRVIHKNNRTDWWRSIVNKHGYRIEIIFTHHDEESALNAEKFFIKSFREQGCELVNLSDGGEGSSGYKYTDEQRQNRSNQQIGIKNNQFGKSFSHATFKGFTIGTKMEGGLIVVFDGAKSMKTRGFDPSTISACVLNKHPHHKGFTFTRTLDKSYLQQLLNEGNFYDTTSKQLIINFIAQ